MNFGEKTEEWSAKKKANIPVWQSPQYLEAKAKAEEVIQSKKYGLSEADFWILKNETKSGKMGYTGLIIKHNGCLKINDTLSSKFDPSCVFYDERRYGDSLAFGYCSAEQGLYEFGEVNAKNCKNEYPYAMALKRLFDRVVLKLSKLAYSGIYSDSESEEFGQQLDAASQNRDGPPNEKPFEEGPTEKGPDEVICTDCMKAINPVRGANGGMVSVDRIVERTKYLYGVPLCCDCAEKRGVSHGHSL